MVFPQAGLKQRVDPAYFTQNRQEYVQAGELQLGERLQTLHGDTKVVVSNLARPGPLTAVYNLEVHAEHTYFVGQDGLLVHNAGSVYGSVYKRRGANYVGSAKGNAKVRYGRDGFADDLIPDIPHGKVKPRDVTRGVEQIVLEIGGGANSRGNISSLTNLRNVIDETNTAIYYNGLTKYQYRTLKAHEFLKDRFGSDYRNAIRKLFDFND